ncbi:DUF4159 domain-containing protein [Kiloniella antarctica]|uniref:DUF4159 domain-containing protein n=1 Tax=Kiloniella antarctica TaxID=1550907 RepID=A0ABW5BGJ7_9PROT
MLELGFIGFLNPWLLLGLLSFPLVWILLRITPPAPRRITFPALRLLFGLTGTTAKPQNTAWWLIILRLLILLLIILALAEPIYEPEKRSNNNLDTLILLDNDWASAQSRQKQLQALKSQLERSKGLNVKTAILSTASRTKGEFNFSGFKSSDSLLNDMQELPPVLSWESDHIGALKSIEDQIQVRAPLQIVWLSNGLIRSDISDELEVLLKSYGEGIRYTPLTTALPIWIDSISTDYNGIKVTLQRLTNIEASIRTIAALSEKNEVLASEKVSLETGQTSQAVILSLPNELHNRVQKITVTGQNSSATTYLMDQNDHRFPVGLLTSSGKVDNKSLLGEHYYLQRALGLFTDIRSGPIKQLLSRELSTLIITDNEPIPLSDEEPLLEWINKGGLLLRFAGPRLADHRDRFLPVPLRSGYRNLAGSLTWEQPLPIEEFDRHSPLRGLKIPKEVTISGQLLAQPSPELDQHTWARLQDGTPLITAKKTGNGHIVLVHTTANTRWSNFALSGSFVNILRRILQFGKGVNNADDTVKDLPIREIMDAYGILTPLQDKDLKIAVAPQTVDSDVFASPRTPPGYYGVSKRVKSVNLAGNLGPYIHNNIDLAESRFYGMKKENPLQVPLLLTALFLFLIDQVVTLWLRGIFSNLPIRRSTTAFLLTIGLSGYVFPHNVEAQDQVELLDNKAIEATLNTYLAYVITGDNKVDLDSHSGLAGLSLQLHRRTAVENVQVTGIDLDRDFISPYPILYWPVTEIQGELTKRGQRQVNQYLHNGGLILFDLRETSGTLNSALGSMGNAQYLQQLTSGLDIPELEPIPSGHVMTRSFYLLESFPGRNNNRDFWAERTDQYRNDGVARILVGSNDWARAWAINAEGRPLYAMVRGGERQRELSYRFGINLVMYALTGNYKEDQVHIPHILERLGQ